MKNTFPTEVLDRWFQHRMLEVHTAMPCKVLAYDASKQTVDVRPQVSHYLVDNVDNTRTSEELPDLYGVPVAFPRAGGFYISLPITTDDYVLVIFSEEPTIAWRSKAREVEPGFLDRHGLNGAFALPMGFPQPLGSVPASNCVEISNDDQTGAIQVKAGEVLLGDNTASEFVALANLVKAELDAIKSDLDAVKSTFDSHTHITTATVSTGPPGVLQPPAAGITAPHTPGSVAATKTKAK